MPKEIQLSNSNLCTVVDDADYGLVSQHCWFLDNARAKAWIGGKNVYLHVLLMGKAEGKVVDHINGNPLDNRRENLRHCTHGQNMMNSKSVAGFSRYKGVYFRKDRNKWRAVIVANGHRSHLGLYETEEDAALAYNEAAKRLHGEYARLNVV
jgi:hypothetical protein